MNFEVLVVDDRKQAALEFARLITVKSKLSTIATDGPHEAIQLVKLNPIKVVLLDQKMPKRNGTELFRDINKIDPLIKAIMLTGEADANEVGQALKLGFSDYIHKSQVDTITPRVLFHYCSYHTDIAERSTPMNRAVYTFHHGPFWNRYSIDFFLVSTDVVNDQYIHSDSWKTIIKIDAGERAKRTISRQKVSRLVIEDEEKAKLNAGVSAKVPIIKGLTAKLEAAVEERFKTTTLSDSSTSDTVEREFKLPNEPADPQTLHVKSRQYEQAPVYQQIRLVIRKSCSCCHSDNIFVINVNLLTSKVSTRQIDFMSDGGNKITETGFVLQ